MDYYKKCVRGKCVNFFRNSKNHKISRITVIYLIKSFIGKKINAFTTMDKKLKINTIYPLFFETSILTSVVQFFFSFHFQARADILRIHSRKMNLTRGINLKKIAEAMPGSSGAEIKVCLDGYKTISVFEN